MAASFQSTSDHQQTSSGFHGDITTVVSFLAYGKLHALVTIVTSGEICM
jgi:hypothetical protein